MAKLEEISELLVSEIRDFEGAVKRLEKVQKAKITMDVSGLNDIFSNHEKNLKEAISSQKQQVELIEKAIGEAKMFPKWAVVIFVISLVLNCVAGAVMIIYLK
ncbi:MAG: DUF6730 family protein [Salinimicrobium sp.]